MSFDDYDDEKEDGFDDDSNYGDYDEKEHDDAGYDDHDDDYDDKSFEEGEYVTHRGRKSGGCLLPIIIGLAVLTGILNLIF